VAFVILSFHCSRDFAQGPWDGCGELRDTDPSTDAPGWEASHSSNGATRMNEEREREMRRQLDGEETGDGGPY
jgi:hypothetical protein